MKSEDGDIITIKSKKERENEGISVHVVEEFLEEAGRLFRVTNVLSDSFHLVPCDGKLTRIGFSNWYIHLDVEVLLKKAVEGKQYLLGF